MNRGNEKIDLTLSSEAFLERYGRQKNISVFTLGCKVNQYESEAIKEQFQKNGYQVVSEDEHADVYVINTCTVTNMGDRKSRQFIRKAKIKNPDSIVVVTGCYAQMKPEEISNIKGVNLVIGTNEKSHIFEYVSELTHKLEQKIVIKDFEALNQFEELKIENMDNKTRALVKIQEGCNQFCSYCIIPYARGTIRSRVLENIISEVKQLVSNGYKEIVLTGINVALYGHEEKEKTITLVDVLQCVNDIEGDFRIRLSSIEPTIIDKSFIKSLLSFEKLCPHLHLSLQSGSDDILRVMNRKYTAREYKELVDDLKKSIENIAITTDLIVGFPGETEENFKETCEFVKMMDFAQIHIFKYSKREGTKASEMDQQINGALKSERSKVLIDLAEHSFLKYHESYLEKTMIVLFESKNKQGYYEGYTENYIKILCKSDKDLLNQFARVVLTEIMDEAIIGKIL